MSDKFALIIAVEKYIDAKINEVAFAENDANQIKKTLLLHGYQSGDVTLLLSQKATKATIESKMGSLLSSVTEEDQVLIFYTGYGFAANDNNYLTCSDSVLGDLRQTSISIKSFFEKIKKSKSRRILFFLDASHSGLAIDDSMGGIRSAMSDYEFKAFFNDALEHIAFASCQFDQYSYSSAKLKHGIWAYHLLEALKGNSNAALDQKRFITADSLQTYVSQEVPRTVRQTLTGNHPQTPCVFGHSSREFIIADCKELVEKRASLLKPKLAQLKNVFFSGEVSGWVKSLSGFQKHYRVPDAITHATESFVSHISQKEIATYADNFFKHLKTAFGYKRKDIEMNDDPKGISILTIDFTFNISIQLNPEDPSAYVIKFEVTEIQNPESINSSAFNLVFERTFSGLIFQFNQAIHIEDLIDAVEEMDDQDLISVNYPGDISFCRISIKGLHVELYVTSNVLKIDHTYGVAPKQLLEEFSKAQKLLVSTDKLGMLPFE